MKKLTCLFAVSILFLGLFALCIPQPQGIDDLSNNGITLGTWYDPNYGDPGYKGGYKCYVQSLGHYNFTQQFGSGIYYEGIKGWNLTRLGVSPSEKVFSMNDWLLYLNASSRSSAYYGDTITRTNTTFSDALGSGITLNVTYGACSASRISVYQIFKFYPTFLTMQLSVKNTYDASWRTITIPKILYQGTYCTYLGTPANVRWSAIGFEAGLKADQPASNMTTLRTPSFWYNTAIDRGLIIDVIDHNYDWCLAVNNYQNGNPSNQVYVQAFESDWTLFGYKTLKRYQTFSIGTLFVQLTGNQIDDAYETLGSVYTTLYPGRGILNGFERAWRSWSAYQHFNPTWARVKEDIDYLATHSEYGIKIISLEEEYEAEHGNYTAMAASWGETLPNIISYVQSKGFKIGLWIAPWRVGSWVLNNATMKSWLLNDSDTGNFCTETAGGYTLSYYLNPTIPGARAFITAQLNQLVSMGVTFFYLDFMGVWQVKQREYTGLTQAQWMEYNCNISEVLPKATTFAFSAVPVDQNGLQQPYFAQKYYNLVRFSWDLTGMDWIYIMPSYREYHVIAALYNHLTVKATPDFLGDDEYYGNKISDAQWRFDLLYTLIGKEWQWSNRFSLANATKLDWVKRAVTTVAQTWNWKQRDYWLNSGVNRIWLTDQIGDSYYLAVFNPTDTPTTLTISLSSFNLPSTTFRVTKILDNNNLGTFDHTASFSVTLAARDAQIFELTTTLIPDTTRSYIVSNFNVALLIVGLCSIILMASMIFLAFKSMGEFNLSLFIVFMGFCFAIMIAIVIVNLVFVSLL
jgi:hypothetical protein